MSQAQQSLATTVVRPAFYSLQPTVAQDTKCSEPSKGYYKKKERPRQLIRPEIYGSKIVFIVEFLLRLRDYEVLIVLGLDTMSSNTLCCSSLSLVRTALEKHARGLAKITSKWGVVTMNYDVAEVNGSDP